VLAIEKSVVISGPLAQVWALLADLKNTPERDLGVTETRVTSDGLAALER
jgi:hypothetical protein